MGLEAVFQYVGLVAAMILPSLVLISIFPWDIKTCFENWRTREKKYFPIFAIKYWVFMIVLGLTLLFYYGGMFELIRTGGTYLGWNASTSPLIVATLGSIFTTIWFPLWFIPLDDRDFYVSHIQAIALFFTILAFCMTLSYTASAWFMLPLCIVNFFMFISMWFYEEKHVAVKYIGPDLYQ